MTVFKLITIDFCSSFFPNHLSFFIFDGLIPGQRMTITKVDTSLNGIFASTAELAISLTQAPLHFIFMANKQKFSNYVFSSFFNPDWSHHTHFYSHNVSTRAMHKVSLAKPIILPLNPSPFLILIFFKLKTEDSFSKIINGNTV